MAKTKISEKEIKEMLNNLHFLKREAFLDMLVGESLEIIVRKRVKEIAEKSIKEVTDFMKEVAKKKDKAKYIDACVALKLGKFISDEKI